jgi:protease YdgD
MVLLLFLTACAPGSSPYSQTQNVFGEDDRLDFLFHEYPWSAIGRLVMGDSHCTSFLVGESLAATNAHCIETLSMVFEVNFMGGAAKDSARVIDVWVGSVPNDAESYRDWALLVLDKPLGKKFGWFDLKQEHNFSSINDEEFDAGSLVHPYTKNLALVGYPADYKDGETGAISFGCGIAAYYPNKGTFLHDCDSQGGSSGGPLFAIDTNYQPIRNTQGRVDLVALHRGAYKLPLDLNHIDEFSYTSANIAVPPSHFSKPVEMLRKLDIPKIEFKTLVVCNETVHDKVLPSIHHKLESSSRHKR